MWKDGQDRLKSIGRWSTPECTESVSYVIRGDPLIKGINVRISNVIRDTLHKHVGNKPIWKGVLSQERILHIMGASGLVRI